MGDPYIGEVRLLSFTYPPVDWILCDGRLLQVQNYQALYSLIGNVYGGTSPNTFGVPDLRGRVVVGTGSGPGLTPRALAAQGGVPAVTLEPSQMPSHTHEINTDFFSYAKGPAQFRASPNAQAPTSYLSRYLQPTGATTALSLNAYVAGTAPDTELAVASMGGAGAGGGGAHENRQPVLVMEWCICAFGNYPPFN